MEQYSVRSNPAVGTSRGRHQENCVGDCDRSGSRGRDRTGSISSAASVSSEVGRLDGKIPPQIAMDWPLSRDEKKSQLFRLYNSDVRMADQMLQSGERALEALQEELESIRRTTSIRRKDEAGVHQECSGVVAADNVEVDEGAEEQKRLRQAVESAAAVLRAILQSDAKEAVEADSRLEEHQRPRSEGSRHIATGQPLKPALSRTPRTSRCGTPKRRVSFGEASCLVGKDDGATINHELDRSPSPDQSKITVASRLKRDSVCPGQAGRFRRSTSTDSADLEPEPEEPERRLEYTRSRRTRGRQRCSEELEGDSKLSSAHSARDGSVEHPMYACRTQMLVPANVAKVGLNVELYETLPEKVYISSITEGTWAEKQGVRVGDVLIAIGGRSLGGMSKAEFKRLVLKERPLEVVIGRPMVD